MGCAATHPRGFSYSTGTILHFCGVLSLVLGYKLSPVDQQDNVQPTTISLLSKPFGRHCQCLCKAGKIDNNSLVMLWQSLVVRWSISRLRWVHVGNHSARSRDISQIWRPDFAIACACSRVDNKKEVEKRILLRGSTYFTFENGIGNINARFRPKICSRR